MKPYELYKLLRETKYNKDGLDVDWIIIPNPYEKKLRLLFQGTASKEDVRIDLQFPVVPYKRQNVVWYGCKGWVKAYKSCNDKIMKLLVGYMEIFPGYTIEVAGHSLGGVYAIYAAEDIFYRFCIKPEVITFGCPKCIWGKSSKNYMNSCFSSIKQYRNINDFITYLPPFIGYKHINETLLDIKFKFSELFNVDSNHHIYGVEKYYKEG